MQVGLIGRTQWLLDAGRLAVERGHRIAFVHTAPAADSSTTSVDELRTFASEHDAPFYADLRIVRRQEELVADICLSVNWVTVLPQSFLDSFPFGVLNAHAGDLPRYRGNATLNWAILAGEDQACLTVHRMVEALDAGPIALKRYRAITPETDIAELYEWLDSTVPESLVAVLDAIEAGNQVFQEQDPDVRPLRVFPRMPQDSTIIWSSSSEEILRLIRASGPPFAGARTALNGEEPIVIDKARIYEPDYDFLAVPGQVCLVHSGNPVIATGDGMIELLAFRDHENMRAAVTKSLRNRLV